MALESMTLRTLRQNPTRFGPQPLDRPIRARNRINFVILNY